MEFCEYGKTPDENVLSFMANHKHSSVWHTKEWNDMLVCTSISSEYVYFSVMQDDLIAIAGIIQVRSHSIWKYGYIQAGFLYNNINTQAYNVLSKGLKDIARQKGLTYCLVDSVTPKDNQLYNIITKQNSHRFDVKPVIPTFTNILDITQTDEEILARMKPKGRYNIKLAQKKSVLVEEGTIDDLDEYYEILLETTNRDGFRPNTKSYYNRFLSMNPEAKFLVARHEGEIIAGGFFVYHGNTGLYYYGASSNHKRNLMAPYLLQWQALQLAKSKGKLSYDFMGIANPNDPNDSLQGVTDFKLKFGDGITEFNAPYIITFNNLSYKFYKFALRIKALIRK